MRVYINNQNRICAVRNTTDSTLTALEIPDMFFSDDATEDLIKCYACLVDDHGHYLIHLLVPPDIAEQINQSGKQRLINQKSMESQLETIIETDHRLSILELGL